MKKLLPVLALLLFSFSAVAAQPGKTFPFTQAQNQDGAKYVWFVIGEAGYKYDYVPARDLPKSARFREVTQPQSGDVAWWPGFVAVVKLQDGKPHSYLTAESERDLDDVESLYGKPHYYRLQVPDRKP